MPSLRIKDLPEAEKEAIRQRLQKMLLSVMGTPAHNTASVLADEVISGNLGYMGFLPTGQVYVSYMLDGRGVRREVSVTEWIGTAEVSDTLSYSTTLQQSEVPPAVSEVLSDLRNSGSKTMAVVCTT